MESLKNDFLTPSVPAYTYLNITQDLYVAAAVKQK